MNTRRDLRAAACTMVVLLGIGGSSWFREDITTYVDVRSSSIVRQTTSYTCGAAASATLLSLFYGLPTSEREILVLVESHMDELGIPMGEGIPALSLIRALGLSGMPAKGYRVGMADLRDYFTRGGLPVIAHLSRPEMHFVVVVGLVGEQVVVADPGWGWSIIHIEDFDEFRAFTGVILVPLPPPDLLRHAGRVQQDTLREAGLRLELLERLRLCLP
ncbi:C39 family peptidase [Candidatus Bipolaricaulota bacterium]